jgi:predicted RNA-binding Zn ribbon-like protein
MSQVPADEPALRLAVDFVNTYDLLEHPADRLTVDLTTQLLTEHGQPQLAAALADASLMKLKRVRSFLYAIFAGETASEKQAAVNHIFAYVGAIPRVVDGPRLVAATESDDPVRQLGALCADALARALVTGGSDRIGTCAANPCKCGYVDRTRAGRQRYCSQLCNDRVAAANYRIRHA